MSRHLDRAGSIRPGEELELEPLARYLREHLPGLSEHSEVAVEQFPNGHSNLTYLIRAGDEQFVLRRPPFGSKVKSAHDMSREVKVLSKLSAVYPLAPEPLVYCDDESVIGVDFYVMRRIHGIILRKTLPPDLKLSSDQMGELHRTLIDELATLHSLDYQAMGLGDLGKPVGYVERQVSGWQRRYDKSRTDEIPEMDALIAWLQEQRPGESGASLIHNDYKLDNVVLDPREPTRIIGVLDWEMATVGDPLMDLGTTLSYWIEKADKDEFQMVRWGPTAEPGSLTRRELVEHYQERSGRNVKNPLFYYCFGLMKTAVVLQQIYYRYKLGHTQDERFAALIFGVRLLAQRGSEAIELGHI